MQPALGFSPGAPLTLGHLFDCGALERGGDAAASARTRALRRAFCRRLRSFSAGVLVLVDV